MSLESKNIVLASDFTALKARIKAEMARRIYRNPLKDYAGAAWDYSTAPAAGVPIATEHVNKLITPVNKISPTGYTEANSGDVINELHTLETEFAKHEGKAYYNTVDCDGGCNGLCRGYCDGTCSGCTGCSGCGGCDNTCSGTCSGSCSGGCEGCGSGCNAGCAPSCAGGCWNDGCTSNCTAACRMDCQGCTGSCSGGCGTACHHTARA